MAAGVEARWENGPNRGARQVTRAIGVAMLLTGLLPLIAIVGFGLWVWAQPGLLLLSVTAIGVLVSMAVADVLLIGGGAYLLSRRKNSN